MSLAATWDGILTETGTKGHFEAQPALTLGDIAPIIAKRDRWLLGITVPGASGDILLSVDEMLLKFPEIGK